jgi:hypothetical protein
MLQDHRTITTIQMDNDQFLPQVVNLLQEGHTVTLPLRGRSMRPFLEDGRDKALLKIAKHYAVGDAVLAEIAKGSFVLHRIIAIDGDDVTLRGDGNLNNEYCKIIDIRAKAIGFYRKGRNKLDSTDGCKWRIYSWWWKRLYSIRRYLLFAMHPHIPRRWRRQTI